MNEPIPQSSAMVQEGEYRVDPETGEILGHVAV